MAENPQCTQRMKTKPIRRPKKKCRIFNTTISIDQGEEPGSLTAKRRPSVERQTPEAETRIETFINYVCNLGCDGLAKLFREQLAPLCPANAAQNPSFLANPDKNRYQDIVCLEQTRVVLKYDVPPKTDYIHANWIVIPSFDRLYIATQSPLPNTQEDFWRMVFQEECAAIVNLTKNVEHGKVRGSQYWPLEVGESKQCGSMYVLNKKVNKDADSHFTITVLEVLPEGCSNSHIVRLFHFHDWPDGSVPPSGPSVLRLIRFIHTEDTLAKGPVVTHCSAGVSRTACVIFIDVILNYLVRKDKTIKVEFSELVTLLRSQRASSFQSEEQFLFAICAILQYLKAKFGREITCAQRIAEFAEKYRSYICAKGKGE